MPQSLAKADDTRKGIDDPKADMCWLGNEEAAVVGPKIKGPINAAVATPRTTIRRTREPGPHIPANGRKSGRGREFTPVRAGIQSSLVLDLHGRISFGEPLA